MTDEHETAVPISWLERMTHAFSDPKDRSQLIALLRRAQQKALINDDSLKMIEGVLQISEMKVSEIMIPRAEMVIISKEAPLDEILSIITKSAHSRFPVIGENKDEVVGILLAKDLLNYYSQPNSERFSIKDNLRPAMFIPESKPLSILLHEFRSNHQHLAIIVDEYGGVSGLVTIEDLLEQIVGEIEDEHDTDDDVYIRQHKDNYYSIKALTPIEEFNRFFHTNLKDNEFDTIGGLVLKAFGHLPKRGETITLHGITFTVLRANRRRIQLLRTNLSPKEE